MERTQLLDAIDGLFAYDIGSTDSGIRDERLRADVAAHLSAMSPEQRESIVAELSPTPDDAAELRRWLQHL